MGAVKRALCQAIGEWLNQDNMTDISVETSTTETYIDAVCHLNQFGTPNNPLMEIACTPTE